MNTKRTEGMGVTAVNDFLFNSEVLVPHVDFNDRTESWDGHIFVYKSKNNKKGNIEGLIPLQVKASIVKTFRGLEKSISMDVADLRNYFNDGGVIIFAVECCGTDRKLYYVSLLPYDLDKLLKTLKQNQKTKTIKVQYINNKEMLRFEKLCREFLLHKRRQYPLLHFDFPSDKVNELLMEGVINKNDNLENVLLSQPQFLYGKASMDSKLYEYVTKIGISTIEKRINSPVQIGDVEYFSGYSVVQAKDTSTIKLGQNIRLIINGTTFKLETDFKGNLLDRIHDTNFVLEFLKRKNIIIAGRGKIGIGNLDKDYEDKISSLNKDLKNLLAVIDIFRLNPEDIDLDNWSENDFKMLNILIGSMVFNRNVKPEIFNKLPGLYYFNIGNQKILTFVRINENAKIVIENFFDSKFRFKLGQEYIPVSPYIILKPEDIISYANLKLDEMIADVTKYEHSPEYDGLVNNLALYLISAYDKSANEEYLECANDLLSWLEGSMDDIIININKLQIVKRNRKLTEHENKYLLNIIDKSKNNNFILCGVYILLDDIKNFEICFEKLTVDEQKSFKSFPIFTYLKRT